MQGQEALSLALAEPDAAAGVQDDEDGATGPQKPPQRPRKPRATVHVPTAAKRLAAHLGYGMRASGRGWILTTPDGKRYGGSHNAKYCLGAMIDVAVSPTGYGMTHAEVAAICRLRGEITPTHWWTAEIAKMQRAAQ